MKNIRSKVMTPPLSVSDTIPKFPEFVMVTFICKKCGKPFRDYVNVVQYNYVLRDPIFLKSRMCLKCKSNRLKCKSNQVKKMFNIVTKKLKEKK